MELHKWIMEIHNYGVLYPLALHNQMSSAVDGPKSKVAQRTTHGGWLGGPYYLWLVRINAVVRNDDKPLITSVLFIVNHHQGLSISFKISR